MDNSVQDNIFFNLFASNNTLSDDEINSIKRNSELIAHKKKEIIYEEDSFTSYVMFLKSGLIKISKKLNNNKSLILKISIPGEFIGIMSHFGRNKNEYTATAIEDCQVYYIDVNIFNSIVEKNGKYAIFLLQLICNENLQMFNRIIFQNQKQLPGKLADIILYFSEQIYKSDSFQFPLTRIELAELAGTTKESFIRTLSEFKNDKIIKIENKWILIKSLKILKTLSRIG